ADEILMRRHAEHGGEEAEEVEAGEAGLARGPLEIDLLVRMRLDPEGGVHGATAIARRGRRRRVPAPGDDVDEAGGERHSGLFGTEIGRTVRGRLRELAEHHQLRNRRQSARAPHLGAADRVDEFRRQSQRQAFVALRVLVRAHELVARMADEDRSRDELERHPANAISEAALADVREREAVMTLDERLVAGGDRAAVVVHDDRAAAGKHGRRHRGKATRRAAAADRLVPDDARTRGACDALEDELDETFGPAVRRIGYSYAFAHDPLMRALLTRTGAPRWQLATSRFTYPLARAYMTRALA